MSMLYPHLTILLLSCCTVGGHVQLQLDCEAISSKSFLMAFVLPETFAGLQTHPYSQACVGVHVEFLTHRRVTCSTRCDTSRLGSVVVHQLWLHH